MSSVEPAAQLADFTKLMAGLSAPSKRRIQELTALAEKLAGSEAAEVVVAVEDRIRQADEGRPRQAAWYVLDSIVKNSPTPYTKAFARHITHLACSYLTPFETYTKLFESWRPIFSATSLARIEQHFARGRGPAAGNGTASPGAAEPPPPPPVAGPPPSGPEPRGTPPPEVPVASDRQPSSPPPSELDRPRGAAAVDRKPDSAPTAADGPVPAAAVDPPRAGPAKRPRETSAERGSGGEGARHRRKRARGERGGDSPRAGAAGQKGSRPGHSPIPDPDPEAPESFRAPSVAVADAEPPLQPLQPLQPLPTVLPHSHDRQESPPGDRPLPTFAPASIPAPLSSLDPSSAATLHSRAATFSKPAEPVDSYQLPRPPSPALPKGTGPVPGGLLHIPDPLGDIPDPLGANEFEVPLTESGRAAGKTKVQTQPVADAEAEAEHDYIDTLSLGGAATPPRSPPLASPPAPPPLAPPPLAPPPPGPPPPQAQRSRRHRRRSPSPPARRLASVGASAAADPLPSPNRFVAPPPGLPQPLPKKGPVEVPPAQAQADDGEGDNRALFDILDQIEFEQQWAAAPAGPGPGPGPAAAAPGGRGKGPDVLALLDSMKRGPGAGGEKRRPPSPDLDYDFLTAAPARPTPAPARQPPPAAVPPRGGAGPPGLPLAPPPLPCPPPRPPPPPPKPPSLVAAAAAAPQPVPAFGLPPAFPPLPTPSMAPMAGPGPQLPYPWLAMPGVPPQLPLPTTLPTPTPTPPLPPPPSPFLPRFSLPTPPPTAPPPLVPGAGGPPAAKKLKRLPVEDSNLEDMLPDFAF